MKGKQEDMWRRKREEKNKESKNAKTDRRRKNLQTGWVGKKKNEKKWGIKLEREWAKEKEEKRNKTKK